MFIENARQDSTRKPSFIKMLFRRREMLCHQKRSVTPALEEMLAQAWITSADRLIWVTVLICLVRYSLMPDESNIVIMCQVRNFFFLRAFIESYNKLSILGCIFYRRNLDPKDILHSQKKMLWYNVLVLKYELVETNVLNANAKRKKFRKIVTFASINCRT